MFYSSKIRLALLSCLMLLVGVSLSVAPALADGNVLRSFEPPQILTSKPVIYFPLGITFDGTNLYYSQPATVPSDIFHITTTGTLLNTLKAVNMAGSLAWDGSHLWVGIFAERVVTCEVGQSGCALLFQVDVSTGNVIKTVDISSIFAADKECNVIDGLSFDLATGSLWVSPDLGCLLTAPNPFIGFAYNVDTSGKLIKRLQFPFGVSGVAVVGSHLYVVDRRVNIIRESDTNGQIISSFPMTVINKGNWVESIGFDPVTFAPACALWAMQPYFVPSTTFDADLVAYQIGCP